MCSREEAFKTLLKSSDAYSEEGRATVRPFESDQLKLLRGAVRPSNALDKVPPHVHEVLSRPDLHIERHSSELEGEPLIKPYWDPSLDPSTARGRVRLIGLLRKLVVMGIVIGVKRKKSDAALFFVTKKG